MNFQNKLRNLIKNSSKSQNQMAKEMGIASSILSKYMNGQYKDPCIRILKRISKYFNVSIDWLVEDVEEV